MDNYFDNGHIDGKQLTPQQIADAIRHKKFGVDVREAMAQGLEYCMTQAQKVPDINQDIVDINIEITKLKNAVFGDGATAVHTISANEDNHSQTAEEVNLD